MGNDRIEQQNTINEILLMVKRDPKAVTSAFSDLIFDRMGKNSNIEELSTKKFNFPVTTLLTTETPTTKMIELKRKSTTTLRPKTTRKTPSTRQTTTTQRTTRSTTSKSTTTKRTTTTRKSEQTTPKKIKETTSLKIDLDFINGPDRELERSKENESSTKKPKTIKVLTQIIKRPKGKKNKNKESLLKFSN